MKKWVCACLAGFGCLLGSASSLAADQAVAAQDEAAEDCLVPPIPDGDSTPLEMERRQQQLLREHQGKIIRTITFRNLNVFDETNEEENNRLYRFLNNLHIHTRKNVIASQLLFDVDDPLDANAVTESERLLRTRNYLANAHVEVSQVCGGYVDLVVYTQDAWTTEPQVSFGHTGGETHSGFGLAEGNVLGSGSSLAVSYRKDADRSGTSYYFSSPHFLNSRLGARIGYSDNSDGEDSVVEIAYPFFSLRTPYSFGLKSEKITQLEPVRSKGEVVEEYRHGIETHEIYFGKAVSIQTNFTQRLLTGITKEKDTFAATEKTIGEVPISTDFVYPWLEYQFIENEFALYRNIDQIQRTEDIAMGKELLLRIGYGGRSWGNDDDVLRYIGSYSDVLAVSEDHILRFSAFVDGTRHSQLEGVDSSVVGGELSYYFLNDHKNRWFARLRYDWGKDLQAHEMLTVGGTVGVRGYPLDFQRGDQRYIFSLERRYFSDAHLFNLFRIGAVAFFDAGRAWGGDSLESSPQHLSNVGVGLRISSSKARIGHVIHIDYAVPTSDRQDADGAQWLIKAEQTF